MTERKGLPVSDQGQNTGWAARSAAVCRRADDYGRSLDRQSLEVVQPFDTVASCWQPGIVNREICGVARIQRKCVDANGDRVELEQKVGRRFAETGEGEFSGFVIAE